MRNSDISKHVHSLVFLVPKRNLTPPEAGFKSLEQQFNIYNTYDTWHLIPETRPYVAPPKPKYNTVDIPGRHGGVDLTETLTNFVPLGNREGTWNFILDSKDRWYEVYSDIMNAIQGRECNVVLLDDAGWYYMGRVSVNEFASEPDYSTIALDYKFYPYKKDLVNVANYGGWLWDPFNFETGYINILNDVSIVGDETFKIRGSSEYQVPTFIVNDMQSQLYIRIAGVAGETTYELQLGINVIPEFLLEDKDYTMYISGIGHLTMIYTGGSL